MRVDIKEIVTYFSHLLELVNMSRARTPLTHFTSCGKDER